MSPTLDEIATWLRDASSVVVLTGAGISTESGIPDFRGPNGVWTRDPAAERRSTLQDYVHDAHVRRAAWRNRVDNPIFRAEPNAGHHALAALERSTNLTALITQNIDGLHQRAGSTPSRVIEIHGTAHEVLCLDCHRRDPMDTALERVRNGDPDPHCPDCGGILKSATVMFGEHLVAGDLMRAQDAAVHADVFLALGTKLTVTPASELPQLAYRRGAKLVIANQEETPLDWCAHAVLREPLGTVLPDLVARARPRGTQRAQ